MNKFLEKINNPRSLVVLSNLAVRGGGFFLSFLITRFLGISAMGLYSTVVNTASAVATPFSQVLANNSTMIGAKYNEDYDKNFKEVIAALSLAVFLSVISSVVFILVGFFNFSEESGFDGFLRLVGVLILISQIIGAVSMGFLQGQGAFLFTCSWTVMGACISVIFSFWAIEYYGFHGILLLLAFSAVLPVLGMTVYLLCRKEGVGNFENFPKLKNSVSVSKFFNSIPVVVTSIINSGVSWVCAVLLVQSNFGSSGVGLVAISTQWLNLTLLPVTSWGGVTIKLVTEAVLLNDEEKLFKTIFKLIRKNLLTTTLLALFICVLMPFLLNLYGLEKNDVLLLVFINCIYALISSVNNVFERFLLVINEQKQWFLFSVFGLFWQILFTWIFISKGLWVFPVGMCLSGLIVTTCCTLRVKFFKRA